MVTDDYMPDGRYTSLITFKKLRLQGNDYSYSVFFREALIGFIFGVGGWWNFCPSDSGEVLSSRSSSRVEIVEQYLAMH